MAISADRVTVSTSPVALNSADSGASGTTLVLQAVGTAGTNDVSLGPATVTGPTGTILQPGDPRMQVNLGAGEVLYAIRAAGSDGTVRVLRLGE